MQQEHRQLFRLEVHYKLLLFATALLSFIDSERKVPYREKTMGRPELLGLRILGKK